MVRGEGGENTASDARLSGDGAWGFRIFLRALMVRFNIFRAMSR